MAMSASLNLSEYGAVSEIKLPFDIELKQLKHTSFTCLKVLRLLAGKRLVCQAEYNNQVVLAKLFFGPAYQRRWKRELKGVQQIDEVGVKTPRVIESLNDESNELAVILFEYVGQTETLDEVVRTANSDEAKKEAYVQALKIIAKLHEASTYQKDIHLDNFLQTKAALYLIDGDQVYSNSTGKELKPSLVIDNLAMFFTQLYPWQDEWVEGLFNQYMELRKPLDSLITLQAVKDKLNEHRTWREKKYIEKKVFRHCSEFNVIKNWRTFCVFSREIGEGDAYDFIKKTDLFIAQGETLKSGKTATVAKIALAGRPFILKRYNKKGFFHQMVSALRRSKAAISWKNGHLLRFNGLASPAPLLLLEKRYGPFKGNSYLLTEFVESVRGCDYFISDEELTKKKSVANDIAVLISNLHESGFCHGDLKSHNILIAEEGPTLIDLDGMKRIKHDKSLAAQADWSRLQRDLGGTVVVESLFKE